MNKYFSSLVLGLALIGSPLFAAHYTIDPMHSEVSFKVKHLTISKVRGKFEKFSGDFNYDEKNPSAWNANATIEAASINTSNEGRDKHLRSADFFETEKYPALTFKSTGVSDVKDGKAKLSGMLNMHGVEKPVVLDLTINGLVQDPQGNTRSGFEASSMVNRRDFGVNYGTGGAMVGEEVEISINVEGVMDKPKESGETKMEKKPAMKKEEKKK